MNWILGIDTSSIDLCIGLFSNEQPVASYTRMLKNSHAEHIARAVSVLLDSNSVRAGAITHIAIAAGPGSFTGLRIGYAFVKGFCLGSAIRVMSVSSLFVLARGACNSAAGVIAAVDARRDEIFWARFRYTATAVVRETPDTLSPVSDFRNAIKTGDTVVTDTMGYARSTVFEFLAGRPNVFPVERYPVQRGFICASAGASSLSDGSLWVNAGDAQPAYLRSFMPLTLSKGRVL